MQAIVNEFSSQLSPDHPNFLHFAIIQQQVKNIKESISSSQQVQQISNQSSPKTIAEILIVPEQSQRSGIHRNFKKKNYGGMNDKQMIDQYEKEQEAKLRAEEEKAEKKRQREEKKLMNEKIKNMKKEKAEEARVACKRKAEAEEQDEVVTKKRGRPSKAATDEAKLNTARKAPIRQVNSIVQKKISKK
jgi:hypothetical protein